MGPPMTPPMMSPNVAKAMPISFALSSPAASASFPQAIAVP